MVRKALRSGSIRKRKRTTPGARHVVHYSRKAPGAAHCPMCGAPLHGVPRDGASVRHTQRAAHRPYGGALCSRCGRERLKADLLRLRGGA